MSIDHLRKQSECFRAHLSRAFVHAIQPISSRLNKLPNGTAHVESFGFGRFNDIRGLSSACFEISLATKRSRPKLWPLLLQVPIQVDSSRFKPIQFNSTANKSRFLELVNFSRDEERLIVLANYTNKQFGIMVRRACHRWQSTELRPVAGALFACPPLFRPSRCCTPSAGGQWQLTNFRAKG